MRTAARGVSILLHPVFMPLYVLGLAMWFDPQMAYFLPDQVRYITLAMVMVMTVAFPLTSTLLLLRANLITSLEMPHRDERIAPFTMTLLYYAMTYYLLRQSPLHPVVLSIFAGIITSVLFTILITLKWKISIHMVGIGGLIGSLAALSVIHSLSIFPVIAIMIVLAGLLGTARLLASDHQPSQIYCGLLLGAVATYACVVLEVAV